MGKKILIITGAGASKSLTHSLPDKDKVGIFGNGDFRELPTGTELIQQITTYQNKSITWLMAYFCYGYYNININNSNFLQFAWRIENRKNIFDSARDTASKFYSNANDYKLYEQNIKVEILKIISLTKEWAIKQQKLEAHSKVVIIGNDNEKRFARLLNSSQFLKNLIDNLLDNIYKNISFDSLFSNEIFLWLIYDTIACDYKIFNKIKPLLDIKSSQMLDLLLQDMYRTIEGILSNLSGLFSGEIGQGYDNPRRFSGKDIIANSIYSERAQVYDKATKKLRDTHCVPNWSHRITCCFI